MKKIKLGIQVKFILFFAVLTLLLIGGLGYATYTLNYKQVVSQYESLAKSSVEMAASVISGDSIKGYLENGADSGYERTYELLQNIKISYGLKYLYVFIPDTSDRNGIYVFDVYKTGDDTTLVAKLGDQTGVIDIYDLALEIYQTGKSKQTTVVTNGEYGYLASAYTAVFDSSVKPAAVVGADIDMNVIIAKVRNNTLQILMTAFFIILAFIILMLFVIERQMIRPIKGLSAHMVRLAGDNEHLSEELFEVRTGDEIEKMADSFNIMVGDIRRYMENLAAVTADRERIATELDVATQIQASMLPSIFPAFPDREEFDIFAVMEPAKEVGGDFYDFFMVDDRRLGIVIADVSGKGVPAALFMVITKTLIKNQAGFCATPAEVLETVNNKLLESNDLSLFVTAFMGILELDTGHFVYSNAGHNPPLISRAGGGYDWLKTESGFVLAGLENFRYKTEEIVFEQGDRLFMYTDGITEALNPNEELFGDTRLFYALNRPEIADMPLETLVRHIRDEVGNFASGAEQADDITVMALSFNKMLEA